MSNQEVWELIFLFLVSFFSLFFKWRRLIFILMSFEFVLLGLFVIYGQSLMVGGMVLFISFAVMSSLLGLVVMVVSMKSYGDDMSVF